MEYQYLFSIKTKQGNVYYYLTMAYESLKEAISTVFEEDGSGDELIAAFKIKPKTVADEKTK